MKHSFKRLGHSLYLHYINCAHTLMLLVCTGSWTSCIAIYFKEHIVSELGLFPSSGKRMGESPIERGKSTRTQ
jgi:hypothetical protein